jgi:hypothetical protein
MRALVLVLANRHRDSDPFWREIVGMTVERFRIMVILLALTLSLQAAYGQSKAEFDQVVDISLNLKQLEMMLESGREESVDKRRYLLLNGTIADVIPKTSWFFLLSAEDLPDADRFLRKIAHAREPLARALLGKLPGEVQDALNQLKNFPGVAPPEFIDAVLGEINNVLKNVSLAGESGALRGLNIGSDLEAIIAAGPSGEEAAYLNRLLLETAYPEDVLPVTVTCELVSGEWISLEEVRSYHGLIMVQGPPSFLVFNRRRPSSVPELAIPANSRALVVATPEAPVESPTGGRVWLCRALYIRSIQ